jgi:phosphomannomutase
MMAMRKKKLSDIMKAIDREYGTYEYRRLDVKFPDDKKARLMPYLKSNPPGKVLDKKVTAVKDTDGYKFICEDGSWLMLRLSGTEPILRIYAEASSEAKALKILEFGKNLAYSV